MQFDINASKQITVNFLILCNGALFLIGLLYFIPLFAIANSYCESADAPKLPRTAGFQYTGDCACPGKWNRVDSKQNIKKILKYVSQKRRQILPVYSCIRDQEAQDKILAEHHCSPRFGTVPCSGRIAANVSEHTVGTAADFFIENFHGNPESLCKLLDEARQNANGGRGGITYYGTDPKTFQAALHVDIKSDWCNWGLCDKVLGDGHCKRTMFRKKKADLRLQLARAKLEGEQRKVAEIIKAIRTLKADCKPGDLSCRDNYK